MKNEKTWFTYMLIESTDVQHSEMRVLDQLLPVESFMDARKSVFLLVEIHIYWGASCNETLAVDAILGSLSMLFRIEVDVC